MKKKITAIAVIAALLAVALIGGTLAYFTDTTDTVTNTFTMAEDPVTITLDEAKIKYDEEKHTWIVDPDAEKRVTENDYENIYPGAELPKDPTMHNEGDYDAYVRMDVTIDKYDAFVALATKYGITDLSTIFGGYSSNWERYAETASADGKSMTYSYLWTDGTDPAIVAAGADTDPIFETVTVPAVFTAEDMKTIDGFEISAFGYGIQADGAEADTLITALKAMTPTA